MMKLKNIDDKQFIHFSSSKLCDQFKQQYRGNIGHTCCYGKGCLLLDVKTNSEMHNIRNTFLNK